MRDKAKMLLLPFNLVCLALILTSFFDKNVAINEPRLMATIQQNLIYALFPADKFYLTRYNFNEGNAYYRKFDSLDYHYKNLDSIFSFIRVGPNFINSKQRWVGTFRGVGNRNSRKLELAQKSEIVNQKSFLVIGRKETPEIVFRPQSCVLTGGILGGVKHLPMDRSLLITSLSIRSEFEY